MKAQIDRRKKAIAAAGATGLAMLICLFGHLGAIGLVGPDEPRYAWIGRAMAQTGDWVTPRLFGNPWFEKPILHYWTAAIGFSLHFPAEWAARLPSAIAALAAAICIGWLGARFEQTDKFCPWSPMLLAPLFFSTSVAAIGFSRAATPDMLFASSITFAMASAAVLVQAAGALRAAATPARANHPADYTAMLCFGLFVGVAVLAKGPAAIILVGGAIAMWALATRHWSAALRLLHPYAIASFCVVALPWYIICARRNPDFVRIFIFQHNFERYVTPVFQHRQPFWFFIPITLLAMLPWTAFLIPAARDGLQMWRQRRWHDSPTFFFACWAVFPILFFSFSESKLPGYILPGVPALALVVSVSVARSIAGQSTSSAGAVFLGPTWIGLAIAGLVWLHRSPQGMAFEIRREIIVSAAFATAGGIAIIFLGFGRQRGAIWISLALVPLLVEAAGIAVLPKLDPYYSARAAGMLLRADLRPDRLFFYDLPRAWQYGLAFYLGRELQEWSPADPQGALVLTAPRGFEEMQRHGYYRGVLDEAYQGIVFVPIPARPASSKQIK